MFWKVDVMIFEGDLDGECLLVLELEKWFRF